MIKLDKFNLFIYHCYMNFQEEFNSQFGDKYEFLHLNEVVINKEDGVCTISFFYPSSCEDITDEDREDILNWFKSILNLEALNIKIKFHKVYLEERLVLKEIESFIQTRYKLIATYINKDNFKIKITPIDVVVYIELSSRLVSFFNEHKVSAELSKFLKHNFLVDFVIELVENKDMIDEVDIENVEMKTSYKLAQRFNVEIIKELVGKDILPKPEYLSFINQPKPSVIVAGYVKKIERKDFVIKKGPKIGQQKAYFNFQIADKKGKLDCIYFCPKKNEQVMDAVEECMFLLLHGDVRLNQLNKLCLYVDKIALASEVAKENLPESNKAKEYTGPVVEIENITSLEQDNMFGDKNKYNDKVSNNTIVVFDVETTGLDTNNDQIIEIGAVKIENGNIIQKFASFVKPTKKISYEITNLTGITPEMVEDAPPIDLVIKDFYDFTKDCIISGHNIINFDMKFIKREGAGVGLDFDNELIDTMTLARFAHLKISRYNLGTVVKALGLTLEGAHRAWNDAYATAQVLLKLSEI